jgi:hypothetical protein
MPSYGNFPRKYRSFGKFTFKDGNFPCINENYSRGVSNVVKFEGQLTGHSGQVVRDVACYAKGLWFKSCRKFKTSILVMEKFPSIQGNLGRKISKHRRPYYPVSTNEIAPPSSIDGNPTFDLEQCTINMKMTALQQCSGIVNEDIT